MKKFTVKASALAIAAALPGMASALIETDLQTGSQTYASELVPASGAVVVIPSITSKLGFGVSDQQSRYVRYDLSGAKFTAALTSGSLNGGHAANDCGANGAVDETLVQFGQANDSVAIYQITANQAAGLTAANYVCLNVGAAGNVTLTSAAGATVSYSLYDSPSAAVGGGASGRLFNSSGPLAGTKSGLVYSVVPATSTASVVTGYKKFIVPATANNLVDANNTIIGTVSMSNAAGVLDLAGNAVVVSNMVLGSNLVITGSDFTAAAANGVTLSTNGNCVTLANLGTPVDASAGTRLIVGLPAANYAGAACFKVNGNSAVAAQSFNVVFDVTAAVGSTASDTVVTLLGSFTRDGTVLKAPIMTGAAGQSTWVQLANVGNSSAPYTVRCLAPTGATSVGLPGTVTAGNTLKLFYNNLGCGAGANSVEFTFAVPQGNVVGTLVRQSTTSGDSALDSLTGNQ